MRTALLVAGKDLRVEWRSRVALNQVLPFAAIVMVMFAFALDRLPAPPGTDDTLLESVAPGLVWLATLFSLLLLVQRTFAVETEDGALDALRAAGVDAAGLFWGKTLALAAQLAVLEALLLVHGDRALRHRGAPVRHRGRWSRRGSPLPSDWPRSVRSTAASLPAHGGGRPSSRCCCSRWWRPF